LLKVANPDLTEEELNKKEIDIETGVPEEVPLDESSGKETDNDDPVSYSYSYFHFTFFFSSIVPYYASH